MTTAVLDHDLKSLSRSAPLRIGSVSLTVRDLAKVAGFYRQALGLGEISATADTVRLGVGDEVLLHLIADPQARPRSRREAGLFHTAFLLPSRAALGRWLAHAAQAQLAILGASDHIVSEAIYLNDPEGNGIEVYADRAAAEWRRSDGMIEMTTEPLDLQAIIAARERTAWTGMPAGSFIGHVHLQVGDLTEAERFYADLLGFDVTYRVPGAVFYSSGGYHHHLATNVWSSRGAGIRQEPVAGLRSVELVAAAPAIREPGSELRDPWGTRIAISVA